MPNLRTAIAAGTTVLALGGLTALAVSAGGTDSAQPSAGNAATAPARSAPPAEVRTVVVTKVIHRTRRAKAPRRPSAPAPVAAAPAPAPVAAPARIVARPAPAAVPPVAVRPARRGDDDGDDGAHSDD